MKKGSLNATDRRNTTLAVVATNAHLSKIEATKLAALAGLGMARSIFPVFTMFDGDTIFALSKGDVRADLNTLGVAASEAVAQAVVRAVTQAPTMGGVPGLYAIFNGFSLGTFGLFVTHI